MTAGQAHSLGQDELALIDELRENGPLLSSQIPTELINKVGFNQKTLKSLVDHGIAVPITVKGNPNFLALRTISAP